MTSLVTPGGPREARRLLVPVLVFASLSMSVMSTLGTPLIPTISTEQHVSLETAQWMLTVTLLVGVVATPLLGRLGDGAHRERVLMATLGAVCVGSVVVATSDAFPQLLLGRALQGIGYGTVPLCIALAREHLGGERQRRAIATLSITVAVGAGLGFPVTGLIAQDLDFHAAFWFGAIFSGAALVACALVVPRGAAAGRVRVDVPGAILLSVGLAALVLAVSKAETWGWGAPITLGLFGVGMVGLAAWGLVELRVAEPLVDLRLAALRPVLCANIVGVLVGMGMYIGMSLINRLVQTPTGTGYGFGASLVLTGLMLMPLSLGSLASQPLARWVSRRYGLRSALAAGALVMAFTLISLGLSHGHVWEIAVVTGLLGVGVGGTFALMPALIVASVPARRTGSAMSLNQVVRTAGGTFGSALAITLLTANTATGAPFPADAGYEMAFIVGGVLSAAGAAVVVLVLPRGRGWERRAPGVPAMLMG